MADVRDSLKEELNHAVKDGNETVRDTLRMLLATIANKEKEMQYKEKRNLTPEEVLDVISFEAKKRRESVVEFEKGNRPELAEKEEAELLVLKKYLPEQMSEEEIRKIVGETIAEVGAESMKEIGKIMGVLMPKVKGKADGNLVNKIVREQFSD